MFTERASMEKRSHVMRQLIIDRFEGNYAICEDSENKYFAIETSELPDGAKPGCVLEIDDEGVISLNLEETEARKKRIGKKQRDVFR